MCRHRNSSFDLFVSGVRIGEERRNVLGGKAVTGAMGVWLDFAFAVKSIFRYFMPATPEIAGVYAVFSPVLPYKPHGNPLPLALPSPPHNYMLCFACPPPLLFNSALFSPFSVSYPF